MPEEIKITIGKDGSVAYGVKGIKGGRCKTLTAFIDKLGNVIESKVTGEMCQVETQQHQKAGQ